MLGSVNNFIQNSLPQANTEKKSASSSDNRSEFEKSLAASDKKSTNESFSSNATKYQPKKFESETDKETQSENNDQDLEANALPGSDKLTPGNDRMAPGSLKEGGPVNAFAQNNPYKVENQKSSAQTEETADAGDLSKKLALQSFMRRMKEELGVDPGRIVKAFSSLSMEELTRPPEENVAKIIQSLGLNEQQQQIARNIFNDMLKQTASQSMADYLKSSGKDLSLNVMTEKEMKQQKMKDALESMNSKFFMKGAYQRQPETLSDDNSLLKASTLAAGTAGSQLAEASVASSATAAPAVAAPIMPMQAADPSALQALTKEMSEVSPKEAADLQEQLKSILAQENSINTAAKPNVIETPLMAGAAATGSMTMLAGEDKDFEEHTSDEGSFSDLDRMLNVQQQSLNHTDKKDVSFAATVNPQVQTADSANIKELIDQAQYLARRGGGEMKIKLNDEGMGEVTMKVAVSGGQLQVQMVTESNETKKMIERGLGELKATLASHQLNVDQIKVDSTQTSLEKQMAQHQEEQQRQSARQFMENFRQDSSAWKRNFYDIPTARSYRSQRDDATQPGVPTQVMSAREKATSKRLNLVA